jgi:hypothetical protein
VQGQAALYQAPPPWCLLGCLCLLPPAADRRQRRLWLFDQLVRDQVWGRRQPKLPRRVRIDDQLKFCGLHDGEIGGFGTLENEASKNAGVKL